MDTGELLELHVNIESERRRQAREARQVQIQEYKLWEERENNEQRPRDGKEGKNVSFHAKDRLRDATMRCDHEEGS